MKQSHRGFILALFMAVALSLELALPAPADADGISRPPAAPSDASGPDGPSAPEKEEPEPGIGQEGKGGQDALAEGEPGRISAPGGVPGQPPGAPGPDAWGDPGAYAGLAAWMKDGGQSGGSYTLTGNVVLDNELFTHGDGTILMDGYGFLVPAGTAVFFPGSYRVVGGGETPVFTIEADGQLNLVDGAPTIETENGCAVEIRGEGWADQFAFVPNFSKIIARGKDAVAVRSLGGLDLFWADIDARGATAVEAGGNARLYLSRVEGELRSEGELLLDACTAGQAPDGARVCERTATAGTDDASWPLIVPLGDKAIPQESRLYRMSADGMGDDWLQWPVRWDVSGVDFDREGVYPVKATPLPFPVPLPVALPSEELRLTVMDPDKPYLVRAVKEAGSYFLELYNGYEAGDLCTLYCSEDGGEHWERWLGPQRCESVGAFLEIPRGLQNGLGYLFQLDMERDGRMERSNLLKVLLDENGILDSEAVGGNRDDSRYDGTQALPPQIGSGGEEEPAGGNGPPDGTASRAESPPPESGRAGPPVKTAPEEPPAHPRPAAASAAPGPPAPSREARPPAEKEPQAPAPPAREARGKTPEPEKAVEAPAQGKPGKGRAAAPRLAILGLMSAAAATAGTLYLRLERRKGGRAD